MRKHQRCTYSLYTDSKISKVLIKKIPTILRKLFLTFGNHIKTIISIDAQNCHYILDPTFYIR